MTLVIQTPEKLSAEAKEALRRFDELSGNSLHQNDSNPEKSEKKTKRKGFMDKVKEAFEGKIKIQNEARQRQSHREAVSACFMPANTITDRSPSKTVCPAVGISFPKMSDAASPRIDCNLPDITVWKEWSTSCFAIQCALTARNTRSSCPVFSSNPENITQAV